MSANPFAVVDQFEQALAEFSGAPYAVATMTGTWAIFLALAYCKARLARELRVAYLDCPARTFISVPMAIIHAGYRPHFIDLAWGGVYRLSPLPVIDGALRFRRHMFAGGLHCLSFHARKSLPIGEGGAILCENRAAYEWLRAARYSGRTGPAYRPENVTMLGWQAYMSPEKAARGLHLLDYAGDGETDQVIAYPDMRGVPAFMPHAVDPKGATEEYLSCQT